MANTAIVYLTAPSFDILDKAVTTEQALFMYGIALGVVVVSLAATVCSIEPAYRHTFVGSKTGKQFWVSDWAAPAPNDPTPPADAGLAHFLLTAPRCHLAHPPRH